MLQYNDFPPGLDTPFNNMVAFLLRVSDDQEDKPFLNYLRHTHDYDELHESDQLEFLFMLTSYGYFDNPVGKELSLSDLLASVRAMIEQEGEQ